MDESIDETEYLLSGPNGERLRETVRKLGPVKFHRHKWSQWSEKVYRYTYWYQFKTCAVCGKIVKRTV